MQKFKRMTMPLINQKTITSNEKRRLLALVAEMKARGIPLPKDIQLPKTRTDLSWGLDENGYFSDIDKKQFKPREELEGFLRSTARFVLLRSGRGGGKTVSGAQKSLLKIMEGKDGMAVNPDLENFRLSTWPELRRWIPWNMVIPKQRYRKSDGWDISRPFTMVFMNGARMYCKGLKDPESARGPNINWLWYDEGRRDPTGLGWKNAVAAVRVGDRPQAWCTTTPAGSLHWTTVFFSGKTTNELLKLLEEVGADKSQKLFEIFETSIIRNRENLDPMFYASMLATFPSGYLYAREVLGSVADEGGALGDRHWFDGKVIEIVPDWVVKQVRFWDLAATEKKMIGKKNNPDETIGSLLGVNKERDKFVIEDQVGGAWAWKTIKEMVVEVARRDGQEVTVCFEQEPASGGKNQVAELSEVIKSALPGWNVSSIEAKKLGDRVLAANTWFGEAAKGSFYIVSGLWNESFFAQLEVFPTKAAHDDRVTSVTGGRHYIAPIRKWSKMGYAAVGTVLENENQG